MSGTNAHVVVEGYGNLMDGGGVNDGVERFASAAWPVPVSLPESVADTPPAGDGLTERKARLLPLSAKSDAALRSLARQYLSWLDKRAVDLSSDANAAPILADMAWTASVGRSHFAHRAAVVFRDAASLRDRLAALAELNDTRDKPEAQLAANVAFLYGGEGSRWVGMGAALYESEPLVRAILDRCDAVLRAQRDASLLEVMFEGGGEDGGLDDPAWGQPAVYALGCALTALWASVGIHPGVVLGDGLGEIAAAQAAGVFGLEDGLRIALARGALMTSRPESDRARLRDDLEAALADISFNRPALALINSVTGHVTDPASPLDAAHWLRPIPRAELEAGAATLSDLGADIVLEIGPGGALGRQLRAAWPKKSNGAKGAGSPLVLSSLPHPADDDSAGRGSAFVEALAPAYEAGLTLSLDGLFAGEARRRISLPGYPFQRRRHWI